MMVLMIEVKNPARRRGSWAYQPIIKTGTQGLRPCSDLFLLLSIQEVNIPCVFLNSHGRKQA